MVTCMALFRTLRMGGYVRTTALDWDRRTSSWRVEIRWEARRVTWLWFRQPHDAWQQRVNAERIRRR